MRNVAEWALRLVTLGVPVVLAACYGAPYDMNNDKHKTGRAIDATTKNGIRGLKVSCKSPSDAGEWVQTTTTTATLGEFTLSYYTPCSSVTVEDVDGAVNGTYINQTVPFVEGSAEMVVEMVPSR